MLTVLCKFLAFKVPVVIMLMMMKYKFVDL